MWGEAGVGCGISAPPPRAQGRAGETEGAAGARVGDGAEREPRQANGRPPRGLPSIRRLSLDNRQLMTPSFAPAPEIRKAQRDRVDARATWQDHAATRSVLDSRLTDEGSRGRLWPRRPHGIPSLIPHHP
jgi:hypothetical protein